MIRRPPISTRTDTLFPYTTLFRSPVLVVIMDQHISGLISDVNTKIPKTTQRLLIQKEPLNFLAGLLPIHSITRNCLVCTILMCFWVRRSEEHTSELQSLMRISYAVFCLNKKKPKQQ